MDFVAIITTIAKALGATADAVSPIIKAYQANRFERMRDELTQAWQNASHSDTNVDDVVFIERVLSESGYPPGLVSANNQRAIPESHLNALVSAAIELDVLKHELAAMQQALESK